MPAGKCRATHNTTVGSTSGAMMHGASVGKQARESTSSTHNFATSSTRANRCQRSPAQRPSSVPINQTDWAPTPALGRPLQSGTRSQMERTFGHDFGGVRVHDGPAAAHSADGLQANAYTIGEQIVFAAGRYQPTRTEGQALLAHELAHVVQQRMGPASAGNAPETSNAERDADNAARAHTAGAPARLMAAEGFGTVQRQDAGGRDAGGAPPVATNTGGAPPVGAGAEGAAASSCDRVTTRAVNADEKKNAALVFGDSLNLDGITITESRTMTFGAGFGPFARTLPHTVYVWPGELDESTHILLMMHEFTHLWQYQHGISVATTTYNAIQGNYDFGGEDGLRKAWASCKHFRDFNTEQQGDICQAYWLAQTNGSDTSAYEPYLDEVRNGGMRGQCDPGPKKGDTATA
jgi:hypothetical protein